MTARFQILGLLFVLLSQPVLARAQGKEGEDKAAKKGSEPKKETRKALPKALEILKLREKRSLAKDETAVIDIRIEKKGSLDRYRSVIRYVLRGDGKERTLLRFTAPAPMRGLAVLTLENEDGKDEQWLYSPSRRKIKRVPKSQATESFAGSGFTFEDFRAETLEAHDYKTLSRGVQQKRPVYLIESRPKTGHIRALQAYSKRLLYIDVERYVIMRIDFYDKAGKLSKVQENTRWGVIGGVYRPFRAKLKEYGVKRITWVRFRRWSANEGLEKSLFTTRQLGIRK